MAGTYIQADVYGELPGARTLFDASSMSDSALIGALRSVPAVAHAHASSSCSWIVATAVYQPKRATLRPPNSTKPECWLAFLDRDEHAAPGWTKVPLVMFSSYERNENAVKVMLPAVLERDVIFLNHVLPEARCFSLPHLIRGKEFASDAAHRPHLLASKIPSWSGRAQPAVQLEQTREFAAKRNFTADLADLDRLQERMGHAGFNITTPGLPPVVDTLWMIWPSSDAGQAFSRHWLHEVARFSSFEKASYSFVRARVPEFKPWLTDAIYVYSPAQRCGSSSCIC
mmetsp:Transcript_22462/g.50753  ORF Transcript_22462/g.50753 Transcript_22462/m.50753 type:complete len:285 (-) Transcript_22462:900-1754(-)